MVYFHDEAIGSGIKCLIKNIRDRRGFSGKTKHWMGASLRRGFLDILPFNFIDDELPSSILEECFPAKLIIETPFKCKRHALLQEKYSQENINALVGFVENNEGRTLIFNSFVICSLSKESKLQALSIDEVADVLEQLHLNPFLSAIEVSRYY